MKPVIFIDFGGVYFTSSMPLVKIYAKKFGVTEKRLHDALIGENWNAHATGKIKEKTYWRNVTAAAGITKEQTEAYRTTWYYYSKPNPGMKTLIRKLKKNYKVAALSSAIIGWIEVLEKKYKISKHFHEHHYTYDHGIDKPSAKFFLSAAKKMGTKPEDCIVVDDMKAFLDEVKKTGARTILFKNAKQLEAQLKKMGIEI